MRRLVRRAVTTLLLALLPWIGRADSHVTLQLRWDHQFQFAGYYAALWQGYYEEKSIDVDIRSAIAHDGTIRSAIEAVASGEAEFGIGSTDVVYARGNGAPLVILASFFQRSGVAFFAREGSGMNSPADLVNLRVSRRLGDVVDVELQAMLLAEGIDPDLIAAHPFDQSEGYLSELEKGSIDVIPGYIIGTPHEAAAIGLDVDTLRPIDYGVDFYGDSLFTSEALVRRRPGLVEAFAQASRRGWEYALDHPAEIADRIIREFTPRFPIQNFPGFVRFQIKPVRELTLYPVVEVGHVNPARWKRMHETLRGQGLVSGTFDADAAIFDPARRRMNRQRRVRRILLIGSSAGVALIALGAVWIALLRRTVRNRTESLALQERRYRELVERSPAIIYHSIAGTGGTFYSPQVALLGYSSDELVADPTLWQELIHPEDRATVDAALAECEPGTPIELTYRVRHRNGEWIWLLDRNYPTRLSDGRIAFAGIALDVSALKCAEQARAESEERFDLAMRFTKDGLYDWDLRTNEIYYSPGWKRMLGYEPEEIADELSEWERLTHEDDVQEAYADLQSLLDGNRSRFEREIRMRHKDGHWVDVLARGNVVFDEHGEGIRVVGTHVDITKRKRMETDLAALVEAKGQLLRELNHRVKNNLLMVSSLVRLKDSALGPEVDLSDIVSQIAAIRGLHEILSVGEDVRSVQLKDYLDHILSTVFSLARCRVDIQNNVGHFSVPSSTAVAIGLIVNEMATNAMKHGFGTDPATFSIEMTIDSSTGQSVLTISNSGRPIPDDVDLDSPTTIGLRLISALAAQLGARVEMQRSPSPVFIFHLPVTQQSAATVAGEVGYSGPPEPASSAGA